jgi:chromosomal replication initiation ATPase DnaA
VTIPPEILAVSEATGVSVSDIIGRSRTVIVSDARRIAAHLMWQRGLTMEVIGRAFNRTHGAVSFGISRLAELRSVDPKLDALVTRLETKKPAR